MGLLRIPRKGRVIKGFDQKMSTGWRREKDGPRGQSQNRDRSTEHGFGKGWVEDAELNKKVGDK